MSIIRTKHKKHNFSIIDNNGLRDDSLSWKATGMLAFLMTKPDDWLISVENLSRSKRDGKDSTVAALEELKAAGYVYFRRYRIKGKFESEYLVFETKEDLQSWLVETEKERDRKPIVEKPQRSNHDGLTTATQPQRSNHHGLTTAEKPLRSSHDGLTTATQPQRSNHDGKPAVVDLYKDLLITEELITEELITTPPLPPRDESERVEPGTGENSLPVTTIHSHPTTLLDRADDTQAKPVSVEVVNSFAPSVALDQDSAAGDDLLDENLSQLLERYNRGEIGKLPESELKMLAAAVIGDTVKLYRRSGKVLSSAPNDIDRQLMQFIAVRDQQDFVYGTRLIAAMERTPSRWGELVELVAAWQLGDVHAIPNAAKQIALHSRLQQNKQSTFEAIKDL